MLNIREEIASLLRVTIRRVVLVHLQLQHTTPSNLGFDK